MDYRPGGYWSHTLGRDLDACDRRVYYRIWAAFGGWSRDAAPLARLLYTARHTKDIRSYAGTVVHEAIQRLVERVRVGMKIPPRQTWLDRFEERMRAEVAYSASRRWIHFSNPKRATLILYEHLVGADLHDWQVDEGISVAVRAFSSFWDRYLDQIVEVGPERILLIDSLDKMELDGFDLYLSPDLVLLEGFETEVIDWKTGMGTNLDQLYAYGYYYADYRRRKDILEQPMVGRSIPLLAPEKELRVSIGPDEMAGAEARIRRDIGRLRALEDLVGPDRDLAFSKASEASSCEWCSFRFHCDLRPPGPTVADAVSTVQDAGWFSTSCLPADGHYLVTEPSVLGPWSAVVRVESGEVRFSDHSDLDPVEDPLTTLCTDVHLWRRLGDLTWMQQVPRLLSVG